jgi:hypothetical protein
VLTHANENHVSISDAFRLYLHESNLNNLLHRTLQIQCLPAIWRGEFIQTI